MSKNMSDKEIRKKEEKFCVDKNQHSCEEVISPSGRFKLLMRYYKTLEGCWDYSRGTIYRLRDNKEVCDIKRNYSVFNHSFIEKNNQEWMITGRSYMSQTIINLDTGEEFELDKEQYNPYGFCWSKCRISPDGNTLAVSGCYWACPYEIQFFDFTDPSKGWKRLEFKTDSNYSLDANTPEWIGGSTIECCNTEEFYIPLNKFSCDITDEEMDSEGDAFEDDNNYTEITQIKTTIKREGDEMVVVNRWFSDRMKEKMEISRIANEKYNAWRNDFIKNDELYNTMLDLEKEYNLDFGDVWFGCCYNGWSETSDGTERRIERVFKINNKRFELSWGADKEKIKIDIDRKDVIWFNHSVDGMKNALKYIKDYQQQNEETNE